MRTLRLLAEQKDPTVLRSRGIPTNDLRPCHDFSSVLIPAVLSGTQKYFGFSFESPVETRLPMVPHPGTAKERNDQCQNGMF